MVACVAVLHFCAQQSLLCLQAFVVAGIAVVYCCTPRRRSLSRTSSPNYNNVGVVVMLSNVVWNLLRLELTKKSPGCVTPSC